MADEGIMMMREARRVILRVRCVSKDCDDVLRAGLCVSGWSRFVCDRAVHVGSEGLVVHNRDDARLAGASEVVGEACSAAAGVTGVHHEGLSV